MGNNHDGIRQIARRDAVWYSRRSEKSEEMHRSVQMGQQGSWKPLELAREKANMAGALAV